MRDGKPVCLCVRALLPRILMLHTRRTSPSRGPCRSVANMDALATAIPGNYAHATRISVHVVNLQNEQHQWAVHRSSESGVGQWKLSTVM